MQGDKKTTTASGKMKDYSVLFELQDFLEKEVKEANPGAFYRSFVPLTEGLGLESPERSNEAERLAAEAPPPPIQHKIERKPEMHFLLDEPIIFNEPVNSGVPVAEILQTEASLSSVMEPPPLKVEDKPEVRPTAQVAPPPIPQPTSLQRVLAAVIDHIFVVSFWAVALLITSSAFNGFSSLVPANILKDFTNPIFQRFALLEFAAIWICYFAVCVGLLDLTFGMWVWHIRVSFGSKNDSNYWMRKMMRVVWSFFFYAPIVPMLLLTVRRKGRNLLDLLSGTHLYVSA